MSVAYPVYSSQLGHLATTILHNKNYSHLNSGNRESWAQIADRVVTTVVKPYLPHLVEPIKRLVEDRKLMPGGRYLYAAGRKYPQLNSCFLFKAEDSREGWGKTLNDCCNALMTGGGIGVVYTPLRAEGQTIAGLGGKSTGPLALMKMVNECGRYIIQGGSRRCLPEGALVHLDRGLIPIEDVKVGDMVLTADGYYPVTATIKQGVQETIRVFTKDRILECTPNHRVAVFEDNREYTWKCANDLEVGKDSLVQILSQGELPSLVEKIKNGRMVETYDLEVAGKGEFVTNGLLVHNSAIWAGLHWNHPDIFGLIGMKDWSETIHNCRREDFNFPAPVDGTNISVILDDLFFTAYDDTEHVLHNLAQSVYWQSIEHMLRTGEPGFSVDVGDNEGENLRNACVPADTAVLTKQGNIKIVDLVGKDVEVWNGFEWSLVTPKVTATNQKMLVVRLEDGRCIKCTRYHLFVLAKGERVTACSLKVGDKLLKHFWPECDADESVVSSITDGGMEETVYCFNEPKRHLGCFSGVVTGQCTEVSSRDNQDMCNLSSINISRINTLEEFATVVELGTAFLLCGTLCSKLPLPEMYKVREKNRRLGLGLMGVHDWLLRRAYRYEANDELKSWMETFAMSDAFAHRWADKLSISRPVATRSIAPTGTISIVAETTSGIEPIFASAYKRRYLEGKNWKMQYKIDAAAQRLVDSGVDPELIEDSYTLAEDVERRIGFQVFIQKYVNHSVSSTINLPEWGSSLNNESKIVSFGKTLMSHLPGLRGITVYPNGSRGGQPLVRAPYGEAIKHLGKEYIENCESDGNGIGNGDSHLTSVSDGHSKASLDLSPDNVIEYSNENGCKGGVCGA